MRTSFANNNSRLNSNNAHQIIGSVKPKLQLLASDYLLLVPRTNFLRYLFSDSFPCFLLVTHRHPPSGCLLTGTISSTSLPYESRVWTVERVQNEGTCSFPKSWLFYWPHVSSISIIIYKSMVCMVNNKLNKIIWVIWVRGPRNNSTAIKNESALKHLICW